MPRTLWAILMVFIAIAAGMYYNKEDMRPLWEQTQQPIPAAIPVERSPPPRCSSNPSGLIGDSSCCDYETVGKLNVDFSSKLHEVVNMPFFRYFKVNLYKPCPFWDNAGLCMNRDCSVETMDKENVPEQWRSHNLGKVSLPANPLFQSRPAKLSIKDQEFCVPDVDSDEVYVDLKDNPERFTGYSGPSAAIVWKAIYEENCFDVSREMTAGCHYCQTERQRLKEQQGHPPAERDHVKEESNILVPPEPAPMQHNKPSNEQMIEIFSKVPKGKGDLQQLMQGIAKDGPEESCLEKRVYYRLISGLHTSISIHICDEWFNQTTGEWGPNLDCFISRVGIHPERLENIYFDYAVVLRAMTKISDYLAGYEFCTGDESVDKNVKTVVTELVDLVKKCPPTFDEKLLFQDTQDEGKRLKNQFRDHFRNITRIMDCVGCEKCRLWGKIQTTGLGTALKVLFSYDDASLKGDKAEGVLSRSEIVALINTFNRLSESISAIERFGIMYQERLEQEQTSSSAGKGQQKQQQKSFIKAPTKEEDDRDAIRYKAVLAKINLELTRAYKKLDTILESKNITQHRTALRNLASWIH
ncbi:hypothetical protein KVV02_006936 [Mortierella alpina]|uniref:Endoplasmic oxidoreductin n=1 Tax=Mortierella alpina TaxID=64518 RepID=A0A9P7ZZE6_MORAP|nr:hypothetical protein KVV02_006936 [Mortierella alpina]